MSVPILAFYKTKVKEHLSKLTEDKKLSSGSPERQTIFVHICHRCPSLKNTLPAQKGPAGTGPDSSLQVAADQVLHRLPPDNQAGSALPHHHHGRAAQAVVVGGHRIVVGAGGEHRDDVAALQLLHRHPLAQQVAALAAFAGQGHRHRLGVCGLVCRQRLILRLVEGIARVVGHAAVHRRVDAHAGDLLDGAHRVQGDAVRPDNRAARLQHHKRLREVQPLAGFLDHHRHLLHVAVVAQRSVLLGVADAKAAAQVQLLDDIAGLVAHLRHQLHHPLGCQLKRLQLKDLRTDSARINRFLLYS